MLIHVAMVIMVISVKDPLEITVSKNVCQIPVWSPIVKDIKREVS